MIGWYGPDEILSIEDPPSDLAHIQIDVHPLAPVTLADTESLAEQDDLADF